MSDANAEKRPPSAGFILSMIVLQMSGFLVFGLLLWWLSGRPLALFVTFTPAEVLQGIVIAAIATGIGMAAFFGFPRLSEHLVREQASSLDFLRSKLGFGAIIVISLCAGIGEEALFRGGIQTLIGDYSSEPVAIVLASAMFAAMHLSKPLIMFLQFLIGCTFGVIYWYTGSLLAVMLGHGLYDIFAVWYVQRELHRLGVFGSSADLHG